MSTPTVAANDGVGLPEATGGDARQRILERRCSVSAPTGTRSPRCG